ncbi:MAG TPA: DmsE family decaheme c-type cytochrome [Candidatus Polarisedimenticolia bacterium]|nr:DmsE family decaheme c-type cytochrome [Candidatus Polarisedimenticolia bacterium]
MPLILLGIVAVSSSPSKGQEGTAAAPPPTVKAEMADCGACHEDQAKNFKLNPHGKTGIADWDGHHACETCHGSGTAHMESGDKKDIRNPGKLSATELNAVCLTCHGRGEEHTRWLGSPHETRNLSCLNCHKIHQQGEPAPFLFAKATEFDTCTSCHLRRKASLMRSAHMPLREKQMTCSSCHNVHGGPGPSMLRQNSVVENCFSCHAEKRAPFLWEHPPVKENCANCHDPHGSLHPRLLVAKLPRLCQQCHDETRHPTQPYSDASSAPEFFPNSRMFDKGCMNCHSQIHGSNHPSGVRFMR